MIGECYLCLQTKELRQSHIVPSFVGKYLKGTSATGRLRSGGSPNVAREDITKYPLLCQECEGLLGVEDKYFAETIFVPLHVKNQLKYEYEGQLIRFCSGQSLRTVGYIDRMYNDLSQFSPIEYRIWKKARINLSGHLLSGGRSVAGLTHHLYFFSEIESIGKGYLSFPTKFNRYCLRAIDLDIPRGANQMFIYTKMCRVALITYLRPSNPRGWLGTTVLTKGIIGAPQGIEANGFGEFLVDRARSAEDLEAQISATQKAKISDLYRSNKDRVEQSETLRTMLADKELQKMVELNRSRYADLEE